MKRYFFTTTNNKKRTETSGIIYRLKNNDLHFVTNFSFRPAACRGAKSEAFSALISCGEIPKKWLNSSKDENAGGEGYFFGDVTKYYSIRELQ